MATPQEYIGQIFRGFIIEEMIGEGAEAIVFRIRHQPTQRSYVLRLDRNDDASWLAAPLNPPRNLSIEKNNVRGSYFATLDYQPLKSTKEEMRRHDGWAFNVPKIFVVNQESDLVPVSSPYKVKYSISMDKFYHIAAADDLYLFGLWEDLILTMLGAAHQRIQGQMPQDEWNSCWGIITGGKILGAAMAGYMRSGSLSNVDQARILELISLNEHGSQPELAQNKILRLCGALERSRLDILEFNASLRCANFRQNISMLEFQQFVACLSIAAGADLSTTTNKIMSMAAEFLSYQPYSENDAPQKFERITDNEGLDSFENFFSNHDLGDHQLFIQEYAVSQPFLALERK